jgi:transposase
MLWAHFVLHQDLQTLLRCHATAFEALGGVPEHILYDRMRTVFSREEPRQAASSTTGTLLEFAHQYGYLPKACKPYRAKTKGNVAQTAKFLAASTNQQEADYFSVFRNSAAVIDRWRTRMAPDAQAQVRSVIIRGSHLVILRNLERLPTVRR